MTPFQMGYAVGGNVGGAFSNIADRTALDQILENAAKTNDPNVITDMMSQILNRVRDPEKRKEVQHMLEFKYKGAVERQKQQRDTQSRQQNLTALGQVRGVDVSGFTDPKFAELATRQPKAPKPTQASQPIDPDQMRRIKFVRDDPKYESASAPQKYKMLTDAGVSRENSKAEADIFAEEQKAEKDERLTYHKESASYDEGLIKNIKTAKKQLETVADIEQAISSGNVKPSSWANIFKGLDSPIFDKISDALLSGDEAKLQASIPSLLEGWKEVFGVRLTDADLRVLQDKLPSIGKTPEANRAVLKILKKYGKQTLLRGQIAKEIKDQNKGLRPLDYAQKIETRFDEMVAPVKIINPKNGRVIEIPAFELSDAIKSGARLAQEQDEQL